MRRQPAEPQRAPMRAGCDDRLTTAGARLRTLRRRLRMGLTVGLLLFVAMLGSPRLALADLGAPVVRPDAVATGGPAPAPVPGAPISAPAGTTATSGVPAQPSPSASPLPMGDGNPIDPCSWPIASQLCNAVNGVANGIPTPGSIANDAANSILNAIDRWCADAADWVLHQTIGMVDSSTSPNLDSGWFQNHYRTMAVLASFVILPLLLLACVQAAMKGDAGIAAKAGFVFVPAALIGTFIAVNLVQQLIGMTDWMSNVVGSGLNTDFKGFADSMSTVLAGKGTGSAAVEPFVLLIGSIMIVFFGLFVFIEMLLRESAIYMTAVFLPVVFATIVFPATAHIAKKMLGVLVAIILSKFLVVTCLSLGLSALGGMAGQGGLAALLAGITILVLTAVIPAMVILMIPTSFISGVVTIAGGLGGGATMAATGAASSGAVYSSIRRQNETRIATSMATAATITSSHRTSPSAAAAGVGLVGARGGGGAAAGAATATAQRMAAPAASAPGGLSGLRRSGVPSSVGGAPASPATPTAPAAPAAGGPRPPAPPGGDVRPAPPKPPTGGTTDV